MRRVLRSMESRIIGTRISNDKAVIVKTSAARTIAGPFAVALNTATASATARTVTIQPAQNVSEKPLFIQCPVSAQFLISQNSRKSGFMIANR